MIGTILNVAGIVIGGMTGLTKKTPLSAATQNFFKAALGLATIICGLWLMWTSLHGSFVQILKQLAIVLAALVLGRAGGAAAASAEGVQPPRPVRARTDRGRQAR